MHIKGKSKGVWLKLIVGPYEKGWKITKNRTCVYEGEFVHMKGKSKGVWLKLIVGPLWKRLENHQKSNLCLWRGQALADVLSYIMRLLLMSWAVPRFCFWCLELHQVSVADVLSCIMLLLLMSWAVSRFRCWCLELCHFAMAVFSILCIAVCFSIFIEIKTINSSSGFRVGKFRHGGLLSIVQIFPHLSGEGC